RRAAAPAARRRHAAAGGRWHSPARRQGNLTGRQAAYFPVPAPRRCPGNCPVGWCALLHSDSHWLTADLAIFMRQNRPDDTLGWAVSDVMLPAFPPGLQITF